MPNAYVARLPYLLGQNNFFFGKKIITAISSSLEVPQLSETYSKLVEEVFSKGYVLRQGPSVTEAGAALLYKQGYTDLAKADDNVFAPYCGSQEEQAAAEEAEEAGRPLTALAAPRAFQAAHVEALLDSIPQLREWLGEIFGPNVLVWLNLLRAKTPPALHSPLRSCGRLTRAIAEKWFPLHFYVCVTPSVQEETGKLLVRYHPASGQEAFSKPVQAIKQKTLRLGEAFIFAPWLAQTYEHPTLDGFVLYGIVHTTFSWFFNPERICYVDDSDEEVDETKKPLPYLSQRSERETYRNMKRDCFRTSAPPPAKQKRSRRFRIHGAHLI